MNRPFLASALLVVLAASGLADSGVPYVGQIVFAAPTEASILVVPDGSGPALDSARLQGGSTVDATIRVQLVDLNFAPIAGFPAEDIWLQFVVEPGTVAGCMAYAGFPGGVFLPDAQTDADGWTEWQQPLHGGGWSEGPVTVYLNGEPARGPDSILHPPVALRANSPDISGDLVVDLTDIVLFTQGLMAGYHYRCDFNWDEVVNMIDIVFFAQGIGTVCP